MKHYIWMMMLVCGLQASSQSVDKAPFVLPFDFAPTFSGNFGEIRATHFHGGIDFKSGGVVGKTVRALADGYISRVAFTQGSGGVMEVVYDNGYTTINRHLEAFLPPIAQRIRELQQLQESYEVEILPYPEEYRVVAGQPIALGGNRGYSFGPHLHLDVLETASGDYIDPIPLFGSRIKDTTAPKATGYLIVPKVGEGVVQGKTNDYKLAVGSENTAILAWGKIGTAIKAYDYMDGANNRCGVHTVELSVDGQPIYKSVVDRFAPSESRLVNSWTKNGYMKSFIDPGNPLRLHQAYNDDRGWVTIDEERDYLFHYRLTDASGNSSEYQFKIKGAPQTIPANTYREKYHFVWDKVNYLHEPGLMLTLPKGVLYDDITLNYQAKADTSAIAYTYRIHDERVNLRDNAELCIGIRKMPIVDSTKYYMARVTNNGMQSAGGRLENGYMKANIRVLGTYTVDIDTVPPRISAVGKQNWAKNKKVILTITDAKTGLAHYKGSIDGKYALFYRPNMLSSQYICDLDPKYITKGKKHTIELIAVDGCGNESIFTDTFVW